MKNVVFENVRDQLYWNWIFSHFMGPDTSGHPWAVADFVRTSIWITLARLGLTCSLSGERELEICILPIPAWPEVSADPRFLHTHEMTTNPASDFASVNTGLWPLVGLSWEPVFWHSMTMKSLLSFEVYLYMHSLPKIIGTFYRYRFPLSLKTLYCC